MSTDGRGHLSGEELSRSVIAEHDLDRQSRDHLQACTVCRRERQLILEQLDQLGARAKRYAPELSRKVVLPSEEPVRHPVRPFGRQLAFGAAAAFALLLVTFSLTHHSGHFKVADQISIAQEMEEDERLMAQVSSLEEDPLPEDYRKISPEESTADIDDTLDFIVPVDETKV